MEQYKKKCECCGKEYITKSRCSKYCSIICNSKMQNTKPRNKVCLNCGKQFTVNSKKAKYCSDKCRSEGKKRLTQDTLIKKYGVVKIYDIPGTLEKKKQTNLMKYGTERGIDSYIVKERIKDSNIKKYGFNVASKNNKVKEMAKATCNKKYGGDGAMSSLVVREKSKQTILKKYGKTNIASVPGIVEKRIVTCNKKYGVDNPSQIDWVQAKKELTTESNYGVPYGYLTENGKKNTRMISKANLWRKDFLKDMKPELEFHIGHKSFDLKVGDILLEIDPWPYHNSSFNVRDKDGGIKDRNNQYNKTKLANDNGYHCIHVFDWDDPEKIKMLLLNNKKHIGARECSISKITYDISSNFLNTYHLQNSTKKNKKDVYYGLYYMGELVEVMVLGEPRNHKARKKYEREILRLCTHKDYVVVGGANKIFNKFIKEYNPSLVISYCDISKFTGNVYLQMGFRLLRLNQPSEHWRYIKNKRYTNLYHITGDLLRSKGFDILLGKYFGYYGKGSSNKELMEANGYVLVYDCGQASYVWER